MRVRILLCSRLRLHMRLRFRLRVRETRLSSFSDVGCKRSGHLVVIRSQENVIYFVFFTLLKRITKHALYWKETFPIERM